MEQFGVGQGYKLCYHPYSSIGHRTGPGGCFRLVENRYNPWSTGQHGTVRVAPSVLQGNQSNLGTHMAKKGFWIAPGCTSVLCFSVFVCVFLFVCICVYEWPFVSVYLCVFGPMFACVCVSARACLCVCVWSRVWCGASVRGDRWVIN
jgi:hypothetical protein